MTDHRVGLVTGSFILDAKLVGNGDSSNLKNSTFDLTIGEIIQTGSAQKQKLISGDSPSKVFLEPREMLFVLSKEEFQLPATITGLATLRTSLTKSGILALNVGIIDPFFNGPISTTLINFSDKPVPLEVGQKFFRVLFFDHSDVRDYKPKIDESIDKKVYSRDLKNRAYTDFPNTYLNVPAEDAEFYYRNFWKSVWHALTFGWIGWATALFVFALFVFLFLESDFFQFYSSLLKKIGEYLP